MEYALSGRPAPDMRVVNAVPSSTPDPGAAWPEFKEVKFTTVVEDTSEADAEVTCSRPFGKSQIRRPPDLGERYTILSNRPWKLVCVTANSKSYQIISDLGLTIAGESNDGQSYELVVGESCLSWLSFHGLELNLGYNPTKPTESDILIHGTWRANSRAQAFFLDRALKAIRLRQSYEPHDKAREACYRDVARSNSLMVLLERAILNHDILVSPPLIIPLLF
jgi:hypothetical protein